MMRHLCARPLVPPTGANDCVADGQLRQLPVVLPDGASELAGQRISGGQRTGRLLPRRQ